MMNKVLYLIKTAFRGYSLPISFFNWLLAFVYMMFNGGRYSYGIWALIGIMLAHIGTNLFDDCIDYKDDSPKQKFKTEYLNNGTLSYKQLKILTACVLGTALLIGLVFVILCGFPILLIMALTSVIILLYPKLNYYSLGEAAVCLAFGVLMYSGISYVMAGHFDMTLILLSIPVGILTACIVYVHSLVDYYGDKECDKRTLAVLMGENRLTFLVGLYFLALIATVLLVYFGLIHFIACMCIFSGLLLPKMFKLLRNEKVNNTYKFLTIFSTARNTLIYYDLFICVALYWGVIFGF